MRELRELSKLPADPEYWERLEAQVGQTVRRPDGQTARRPDGDGASWWALLATRAGALSGLAIAAGIAALLLVPPRTRGGTSNPTILFRLPDDPAMAAFLSSPTPPSLASLMASIPRSQP